MRCCRVALLLLAGAPAAPAALVGRVRTGRHTEFPFEFQSIPLQ